MIEKSEFQKITTIERRMTLPDLKGNVCLSPHVVLLGAGASLAAFPTGDKYGQKLPLMKNLIEVIGLTEEFERNGINYKKENFEILFESISKTPKLKKLRTKIESEIYEYFVSMEIPEYPTIYDYLVLFLREKDWIFSFNWDPFLMLAYERNSKIKRLPNIAFLHGNVLKGVCNNCKVWGYTETKCNKCGKDLSPSKLLYPVGKKNYHNTPDLVSEWSKAKHFFSRAYLLTIFGYSAPSSDKEAVSLLLESWTNNPHLNLSELELIDIIEKNELVDKWSPFLYSHHYKIHDSFIDSLIFKQPRRSCEGLSMATLNMKSMKRISVPEFGNIFEMHEWIKPYLEEEEQFEKNEKFFEYNISKSL